VTHLSAIVREFCAGCLRSAGCACCALNRRPHTTKPPLHMNVILPAAAKMGVPWPTGRGRCDLPCRAGAPAVAARPYAVHPIGLSVWAPLDTARAVLRRRAAVPDRPAASRHPPEPQASPARGVAPGLRRGACAPQAAPSTAATLRLLARPRRSCTRHGKPGWRSTRAPPLNAPCPPTRGSGHPPRCCDRHES